MGWSAGGEEFEAAISEWDENKRLKLVYAEPTAADEIEAAAQANRLIPFQIASDYHLEARAVATHLSTAHTVSPAAMAALCMVPVRWIAPNTRSWLCQH